jgi:hypothetical protein
MIIVSGTAEELRTIRDALIHAGNRRNRNGLNPDLHRQLAETFNAALRRNTTIVVGFFFSAAAVEKYWNQAQGGQLSDGEIAATSALAPSGHSESCVPAQWLSTREIAKRLGCSTRQARRIAQKIGRQIGTDWFIAEDKL